MTSLKPQILNSLELSLNIVEKAVKVLFKGRQFAFTDVASIVFIQSFSASFERAGLDFFINTFF